MTLSSICGLKPNDVSVTVNVGAISYGAYATSLTQVVPTPVINETTGKTLLCSGTTNNYTIPNAPCGATFSWVVNQSNVTGGTAPYMINQNNIAITNSSSSLRGFIVLTGTINTACGSKSTNYSVNLSSGAPYPTIQTDYPTLCPSFGGYYTTNVYASTYTWNWDQNSMIYYSGGGGYNSYITLQAKPVFGGGWISLTLSNACGTSPTYFISIGRSNNCPYPGFIITPNPASSIILINAFTKDKAGSNGISGFTKIDIYNKMGTLKKRLTYLTSTKSASIDVSFLPVDTYSVRIFNGSTWEHLQLIITK